MPSNKDFQKLKSKWYDLLAKDGFVDIENADQSLKNPSSQFAAKKIQHLHGGWQTKATYYSLAERFAREYKFSSQDNKTIWTYHSQGLTSPMIAKKLKDRKIKDVTYQSVWEIINRLEVIMLSLYLAPDPIKKETYE